jgi:hypothetical protein
MLRWAAQMLPGFGRVGRAFWLVHKVGSADLLRASALLLHRTMGRSSPKIALCI